ncbi:hypothetical protein GCM10010174_11770 [Kutzneria viridogrisea]|uniref:Uncharacterized protein n=1 Tax=Kutzneria viridogrisea TaxID=47990 RepID=A0ABR6BHX1_9PSEU|nr:hypothetical protein [Kutzneria viridogrisea]
MREPLSKAQVALLLTPLAGFGWLTMGFKAFLGIALTPFHGGAVLTCAWGSAAFALGGVVLAVITRRAGIIGCFVLLTLLGLGEVAVASR